MITSFRMYNAVPGAAAAWRALFAHVFARAGVAIEVIEHGWPMPIADLWGRPDLACGFMCGWPFSRAPAMQAIAAPVPSPARYAGLPRYCSEFLVREASGWSSIGQAFGHRFGWMAEDSQSGFNAPRAYLASFVTPQRPRLFAEALGPLGTPATTLAALREEKVDLVALDSYFLDLVRHHEPSRLGGIRTVATTPWTPIPLLVAAPGVDVAVVERLRGTLLEIERDPLATRLLADVLVRRFVAPDLGSYAVLERMAGDAAARGYAAIR